MALWIAARSNRLMRPLSRDTSVSPLPGLKRRFALSLKSPPSRTIHYRTSGDFALQLEPLTGRYPLPAVERSIKRVGIFVAEQVRRLVGLYRASLQIGSRQFAAGLLYQLLKSDASSVEMACCAASTLARRASLRLCAATLAARASCALARANSAR